MVLKKGAFTAAMGDQVEFQMEVGRKRENWSPIDAESLL
jgi:hypothetical protein